MPSIQPHRDGFRVHYSQDGKRLRSQSFPTREAADLWLREQLPTAGCTTFLGLIELWAAEQPTPYRVDAAHRLARAVTARAWGDVTRLTLADLRAWQLADSGWRQPSLYLRSVLHWAAEIHRIEVRPEVLRWKPPRAPRKAKPTLLTESQVEAIRDCAATYGPRAYALIDYLLAYGARPITACRLRHSHIDMDRAELILTNEKHSGGWRHQLYDEHLASWPALAYAGEPDEVPIFPHYKEDRPWRIDRGRGVELVNWYHNTIAKKLSEKLGKLTGIYHLKRFAITRMFHAGLDPATIAQFTGHRDQSQVMTYSTSNSDVQRTALQRLAAFSPHPVRAVPQSVPPFPSKSS